MEAIACGPRVRWCSIVFALIAGTRPGAGHAQAHALDLAGVLAHAERHAPAMTVARARLGLGRAALRGAEPALADNPALELAAGPRVVGEADPSVDFKVRLEQRVELGGQRDARQEAARGLDALERTKLAALRFALRVDVRAAFHGAVLARAQADAARAAEAVQVRMVQVAQARFAAGDTGQLPVRVAEAGLGQASAERIAAEAEANAARFELALLAGLPDAQRIELAGAAPGPIALPALDALVASARKARPERRIALAELALAERSARLAAADSWSGPTFGLEFSHEGERDNVLLGSIGFPLPLFARNQAARARGQAEAELAHSELAAADAGVALRVAALRSALEASAARMAVHAGQAKSSLAQNLSLLERAFELGEVSAFELGAARTQLLEAERSALTAHADYVRNLAALERETGLELGRPGRQP